MTIIEGEVVGTRDLDLLPPSKDEKLATMSSWTPERQVEHVTELLVGAHAGLLVAIAAQDLPGIVEAKQKAATIQEISKQLRMGKDMQLHAAEFVRRAERGVGLAIRDGQERGTIRKHRASRAQGHQEPLKSPTDFVGKGELTGRENSGEGIYGMTDGVSDEAFEQAIADAREEGNLSRANVARKCKTQAEAGNCLGKNRVDQNEAAPLNEQPSAKKRLTKHDSTEMLANINGMLNGIVESLPFINPAEIDFTEIENRRVVDNMRNSMSSIRKLLKEIEHG